MESFGKTVSLLLVDDEPANLLSLEAILEPLGERLVQAQSGHEALKRVLEEDFAVILLDVRMPDISGIETATLIRSRKRSQTTPIIFLTGLEKSDEMMFEGYSAGAVDYLTKPVVPAILRAKVEVFIELERARSQLKAEVRERERAAAELAKLNALLAHRNEELAAANSELDAFCAAVSHDLRAPLSHVEGFIELLQAAGGAQRGPKETQYLAAIGSETARMRQLIGDFLRFARLGAAQPELSPVDMHQLVREAVDELSRQREAQAIEWQVGELPAVEGDERLLRQVWLNLLSNAMKYSSTRQPARIRVAGEVQGPEVVYSVADNGVGFDPQRADRLFNAFFRMHSAAAFEGVGIGLASVKRVVQRHGGRVWAKAKPDEGATFCFALPARA